MAFFVRYRIEMSLEVEQFFVAASVKRSITAKCAKDSQTHHPSRKKRG